MTAVLTPGETPWTARYVTHAPEAVSAFLARHPFLVPVLTDAMGPLVDAFGAETPFVVAVETDPEVAGWTELVNQSRHDARRRLEDEVRRLGAEGVVVAGLQMRVRTRDCPAAVGRRDHIAEVTLTGTAIAGFSCAGRRQAGPRLAVMSVDPRRRQGRM